MRLIDADVWIKSLRAIVDDLNSTEELKDYCLNLVNEVESQVDFQRSKNESGEHIGKSMLVFDTPKGCAMCPAFQEDPDANPNFTYYCGAERKYMNYRECYDVPNASAVRPDWCPIIEAR